MTGLPRVTPAEVAAAVEAEHGVLDEAAIEEVTRRYQAYHRLDDAVSARETTRMPANARNRTAADVGDSMDREDHLIMQFALTVGRPPTPDERLGASQAGCGRVRGKPRCVMSTAAARVIRCRCRPALNGSASGT